MMLSSMGQLSFINLYETMSWVSINSIKENMYESSFRNRLANLIDVGRVCHNELNLGSYRMLIQSSIENTMLELARKP